MVLFRFVVLDLLHICVVFFVRFLHNHSVLLINPGVLCGEKDLCFVQKILEKGFVEMLIFSVISINSFPIKNKFLHVRENRKYSLHT